MINNKSQFITISDIESCIGVSKKKLIEVYENIDRYYYTHSSRINGKKRIFHTAINDLKKIQDLIHKNLFTLFPLPSYMIGARKGSSHITNAKYHTGNKGYILKLDIKDFFPSITSYRVRRTFKKIGLDDESTDIIVKLVTRWGQLPQGVSTSTYIAQLVILPMVKRFRELCKQQGFRVTFYNDDITITGGRKLKNFEKLFIKIINEEGFKDNKDKRKFSDIREKQLVNNLVINSGKPSVLRKTRNQIRANLYNLKKNSPLATNRKEDKTTISSLLGSIQYVKSVNEHHGEKLLNKFKEIPILK